MTQEEIEYQLMVIFGRAEMKKDIKDAAKYIFKLLKNERKKHIQKSTGTKRAAGRAKKLP